MGPSRPPPPPPPPRRVLHLPPAVALEASESHGVPSRLLHGDREAPAGPEVGEDQEQESLFVVPGALLHLEQLCEGTEEEQTPLARVQGSGG